MSSNHNTLDRYKNIPQNTSLSLVSILSSKSFWSLDLDYVLGFFSILFVLFNELISESSEQKK